MSETKIARFRCNRLSSIRPKNYNLAIRKLTAGTVLYLLGVLGKTNFFCLFHGEEIWSVKELTRVVNPRTMARRVRLQYVDIHGLKRYGSLLDLLFDHVYNFERYGGAQ